MSSIEEFWDGLSSIEQLYELRKGIELQVDGKLERAEYCLENCLRNLYELSDTLKSGKLLRTDVEEEYMNEIYSSLNSLERTRDFIDYNKKKAYSYQCEIDLMERLYKKEIESRYSGETTAIDVFAKKDKKIILIQVKSTIRKSRTITKEEIKDLLLDSIFFERYPVFDVAFWENGTFVHVIIPIEEIISKLEKKSISISMRRLKKLLSYSLEEFINRFSECDFPIVKYDENQFNSWLEKVN